MPTPKKARAAAKKPAKKISSATSVASEMPSAYSPAESEPTIQALWEAEKIGVPRKKIAKTKMWSVMHPPPNVTGSLHLGHALDVSIKDTMARYRRMQGLDVLWLPGTDHAGIATQALVEKKLRAEGQPSRHELGREAFLEKVWEQKAESHASITNQLKKLGGSVDWDRERFTMDDGYQAAVSKAFQELHKKGLIYRDTKLVNWDPGTESVISDIEVDYKEVEGHLYFIRYFVNATDRSICVATTRPETMLGDTAIAVHPDDPRYAEFIGKKVILPIMNRLIPIVADTRIDPKFGTGAVKITPAHDMLDAEIGKTHGLKSIMVIGPQGRMTKHAGRFRGLTATDARRAVVRALDDIGNLEKIVKHLHQVGFSSRSGERIEPMESQQWFMSMKPLADMAIKAVKKGELQFVSPRFENEFIKWMENIHDWCISRQLWWGHQIPAWYRKKVQKLKKHEKMPEIVIGEADPNLDKKYGGAEYIRDPDVLDTWFSAGLWPFAALGWPKKTQDMADFFPNSMMECGRDILFFWVARMVTMSLALTGKVPFKEVYLHGLVRDEEGKKMSKSWGNVIDPLDMMNAYGTDALRLSLTIGNAAGNDLKFGEAKITGQRNFVNKLWNASRFVIGQMNGKPVMPANPIPKTLADKWILSKLNRLVDEMTHAMEKHAYAEAGEKLEQFVRSDFCDWYLELSKEKPSLPVLGHALATILKLAHPFMPFVTEQIWGYLQSHAKKRSLLARESWPKMVKARIQPTIEEEMQTVLAVITAIRAGRAEVNVEPAKKIKAIAHAGEKETVLKKNANDIKRLARLASFEIKKNGKEVAGSVAQFTEGMTIYLPLSGMLDKKQEKTRLESEKKKVAPFVASLTKKLANEAFVKNAPKNVIDSERAKLAEAKDKLGKIEDRLKQLK